MINSKFSPKTYIQTVLYDKVEVKRGKRRKTVSQEEFTILEFSEFEKLLCINYNVRQLKQMCRHYKQKVSGNKTELINRMYNFLKYSHHITMVQKHARGWMRRNYFKINGIKNRKNSVKDGAHFTVLI